MQGDALHTQQVMQAVLAFEDAQRNGAGGPGQPVWRAAACWAHAVSRMAVSQGALTLPPSPLTRPAHRRACCHGTAAREAVRKFDEVMDGYRRHIYTLR